MQRQTLEHFDAVAQTNDRTNRMLPSMYDAHDEYIMAEKKKK